MSRSQWVCMNSGTLRSEAKGFGSEIFFGSLFVSGGGGGFRVEFCAWGLRVLGASPVLGGGFNTVKASEALGLRGLEPCTA